jgi:sigma-B regulation protein RsbU (phosphoserine phosphatase)
MRFRTAVFAGIALLVVTILVATVGAVAFIIERSARADLEAALRSARLAVEELQSYRSSLQKAQGAIVAEEPRLKAVVGTLEITPESVAEVAREMRKGLGVDVFVVANAAGELLADGSAEPFAPGGNLRPLIGRALEEGSASQIWSGATTAYQLQATRIGFAALVIGVVVLGSRLDDTLADAVYRQTGTAVVILQGDQVVASSHLEGREMDRAALATALAPLARVERAEISYLGERHLSLAGSFPGHGGDGRVLRYVVLRSLDHALAPGRQLVFTVLAIAAAALLGGLLIAVLVAQRLASPLLDLLRFTREVGAGALDSSVKVQGPYELRLLGESMNRMAAELRSSRRQLLEQQRLEREMEIARRIQTSLLPRQFSVSGMEIAALMHPATEVGGDYYDVYPVADGCWIGIGDVAGHGLTSGLVMMMVQSVVAALVRQAGEARPSQLLGPLNEVLYTNIRERLGQDEHVTFTLLRCFRSGEVLFAGAHEDLLVWRAQRGAVEQVPTPGTWLGAMPDVRRHTVDTGLELAPGDLLVLYTDGVIEAENAARQRFGIERLIALVEQEARAPVGDLCVRIATAVAQWQSRQEDDISVLVLRRRQDGPGR